MTYAGTLAFGLHDELALLVQAGLTPMQALQAAARNPAVFPGRADEGTVEVGKVADLVLPRANPLEDIHNTTQIRGVALRGDWLDRARLDALLKDAERKAAEE